MKPKRQHRFDLSTASARALQDELAGRVETRDRLPAIRRVAGLDVGFDKACGMARAAAVILSFPALQVLEQQVKDSPMAFPYVPGLLSFREVPPLLTVLEAVSLTPDLILCDGQGIAHPRRFGLACHLGVLLDVPSIGVAKSRLIGTHEDPGPHKGQWAPLTLGHEILGAVLRSRDRVKPLYVSSGHRIGLDSAIAYCLACTTRYRLPQTTRLADSLASRPGRARG